MSDSTADREDDTGMSDEEFERVEDRLDGMTRQGGAGRTSGRRLQRKHSFGGALFLAAIAAVIVLLFVGGGASRPSCAPKSTNCRETSDGYWVPGWYCGGLVLAQFPSGGNRVPSTAGAQPTEDELDQAGATPEEADEAESYAQSADGSSDSDDSGDDDGSDDSGDDGGDGGGDGGD
jgi:hypothetical protein